MVYIIENVQLMKQDKLETMSLLVDENRILSVQRQFPKYLYMKMNAKDFIMTSTYVFINMGIPNLYNDSEKEEFFKSQFIMQGCTTVVGIASIKKAGELEKERAKVIEFFSKSSLDFIVAVKIPAKQLTVPFIQKCKKCKIPALFIEYEDKRELYKIPWGWIREAMFPYNSPLIPAPVGNEEEVQNLLYHWQFILEREKIPHISKPLNENTPLNLEILKKIGIYPLKGYLQAGGELSYNLYLSKEERTTLEDKKQLFLAITVHKGKIIRVGKKANFFPDNGEEITINRPSFFK